MILAEKIAQLRRQKGWSQEELANHLQVSRQAVSKWEGGASIPDLDKILKLSALFEVSTDYLLKDELEAPEVRAQSVVEEIVREPLRTVTLDEANDYLALVQASCGRMAVGVGLCILCPAALLLLGAWADGTPREDFAAGAGIIILLVLVALGLLCILPAAMQLEGYEYLEKEPFQLEYGVAVQRCSRMQNSSPPKRESRLSAPKICCSCRVTSHRTRSPARCPSVSLMVLK